MTRHTLSLRKSVLSCLSLALASTASAQSLDLIEIIAFRDFENGVQSTLEPFNFEVYIEGTGIESATVHALSGTRGALALTEDPFYGDLYIEESFASSAELREAWPTGDYVISINGGEIIELVSHNPLEPTVAISILTPNHLDSNVATPLTITWPDCSGCGGNILSVAMERQDGSLFADELLPVSATSWSPPANILVPGATYEVWLDNAYTDFLGTLPSGTEYVSAFSVANRIVFSLDAPPTPAAEFIRLGSPPNPNALRPGLTGGPVIGTSWFPYIDHSSFSVAASLDFVMVDLRGPLNFPTSAGTLLCFVPPAEQVFFAGAGAPIGIRVPADPRFVGMFATAQGGSSSPVDGLQLTNAIDILVGNQ